MKSAASQIAARSVTHTDLESFRQLHGMTFSEIAHLFGIPVSRMVPMLRGTKPIKDVSTYILLRIFLARPDLIPQQRINVLDLKKQFGSDLSFSNFALMLGREVSTGYRWQNGENLGTRVSGEIASLCRVLMDVPGNYELLLQHMLNEASARGKSVFEDQSWTFQRRKAKTPKTVAAPAKAPRKSLKGTAASVKSTSKSMLTNAPKRIKKASNSGNRRISAPK